MALLGGVLKMRRPQLMNQVARSGHTFLSVFEILLWPCRLTRWLTGRLYTYDLRYMDEPEENGWATQRRRR